MKVSYAGVDLLHATAEVRDIVERQLRPEEIFQTLGERGRGTAAWTYINHNLHKRGIKLDSIYWPMGALRWSVASFICSGEDLTEILKKAVINGVVQKCQLKWGDGVHDDLSAYMSMLPPLPLFQYGGLTENLYLITLVDDRYYWWFADSIDLVISEDCDKTWAEVLTKVLSALGPYQCDTPHPAYLRPCHNLTSHWEFLPVLLETAAYNVGMRVHVDTDQSHTIYVKNANSALKTNDDLLDQDFVKVLGPQLLQVSDDDKTWKERSLLVPKRVTVRYPKKKHYKGRWDCKYDIVTKRLVELPDIELFNRLIVKKVVGFNQAKMFHDTAVWLVDGSHDNTVEVKALTTQIAIDFYKYCLGRVHGTYAGIHSIAGHGLLDSIEWLDTGEEHLETYEKEDPDQDGDLAAYSRSGIYTVVRRPMANDLAFQLLHCGKYGCDPVCDDGPEFEGCLETFASDTVDLCFEDNTDPQSDLCLECYATDTLDICFVWEECGVVEWTSGNYFIDGIPIGANHQTFVYRGSEEVEFGKYQANAAGLCLVLKNQGTGFVKYQTGDGPKWDYVGNNAYSLEIKTPHESDNTDYGTSEGGINYYGVREISAPMHEITYRDWAKALSYVGTGDSTFILPELNEDMDSGAAFRIINNGVGLLTVTGVDGTDDIDNEFAYIDGLPSRTLFPCQGATFFSSGRQWVTMRGIPCTGQISTDSSTFVLKPEHHAKQICYTGTGTMVVPYYVQARGFFCSFKNLGNDFDSLIKIQTDSIASTTFNYVPPYRTATIIWPGPGDPDKDESNTTPTFNFQMEGGLTEYGTRSASSSDLITNADWSRCVAYTGSSAATFTLPTPTTDHQKLFAVAITHNGSSGALSVTTPSGTIDGGSATRVLYPCNSMWFFSTGTGYITERGTPCVIVYDTVAAAEKYPRQPNFNATTPAAPALAVNGKWQSNTDLPDKVSVHVTLSTGLYVDVTSIASYSGFGTINISTNGTSVNALTTIYDTSYGSAIPSVSVSATTGAVGVDYDLTAYDADNVSANKTGSIAVGTFMNFESTTATWTTSRLPIIRVVLKLKSTVAGFPSDFKTNILFHD